MQSMADQLERILRPRIKKIASRAGKDIGEKVAQQMKDNTRQGRGFGHDPYDSGYSQDHARKRRKRGLQTQVVDLRMDRRRIEQTRVEQVGGKSPGVRIGFQEGGEIFQMHHKGEAKGGKTRSIFPKSPESIPPELKDDIARRVGEVLRGTK